MAADDPDQPENGHISHGVRPTLAVVTGYGDDRRAALDSDHKAYGLAHIAWRHQDEWCFEMWRDFWREFLPHWPQPKGAAATVPVERLGRVTARSRRDGHTFKAIDAAVAGWGKDTPRGAGARAEAHAILRGDSDRHRMISQLPGPARFTMQLAGDDRGSARPLPLPALAVLPRVYSPEAGDASPSLCGFNLLDLDRQAAKASPAIIVDLDAIRARLDLAS